MYYVHTTPGRMRIKIPELKNRPRYGKKIEGLFARRKGIENLTLNPVTGSVVFEYDEDRVDPGQILEVLKKNRLFDDTKIVSTDTVIDNTSHRIGKAFSKAVFGWAVGSALEGSGLSFLAALI